MSFLLRHFTAVLCTVLAMLLLLIFIAWSGLSIEQPRIASTPDYRIPRVLLQERASDADVQVLLERPLFWRDDARWPRKRNRAVLRLPVLTVCVCSGSSSTATCPRP